MQQHHCITGFYASVKPVMRLETSSATSSNHATTITGKETQTKFGVWVLDTWWSSVISFSLSVSLAPDLWKTIWWCFEFSSPLILILTAPVHCEHWTIVKYSPGSTTPPDLPTVFIKILLPSLPYPPRLHTIPTILLIWYCYFNKGKQRLSTKLHSKGLLDILLVAAEVPHSGILLLVLGFYGGFVF